MKHLISCLLMSALLFGVLNSASAQQKISIQGIVKNGNGGAVPDADYSLTFTLYDSVMAGNVVWTETQPAVTVTGGVYSALLGSAVDFSAVAFDEPYFLGVKVGSDVELTPRTEMTYAPYALAVDKIKSSVSTGNSFSSTGNVGIGTNAPSNKLTVVDGAESALTIKTSDNTINNGIAFQNSGTAYTWNIKRDDVGINQADLVISGGTSTATVTALPERLRIKQADGTVDIKNNIQIRGGAPTAGKVLTATDATGNAEWQNPAASVVVSQNNQYQSELYVIPNGDYTIAYPNPLALTDQTPKLAVKNGDVISVHGTFDHRWTLEGGYGNEQISYWIGIEGSDGCPVAGGATSANNNNNIIPLTIATFRNYDFNQQIIYDEVTANCTGNLQFNITMQLVIGDDANKFRKGKLIARKN